MLEAFAGRTKVRRGPQFAYPWSRKMDVNNFCHFTSLKTEVPANYREKYKQQVDVLREKFKRRFSDFKRIEPEFNLLTFPFTADINSAPQDILMELIDL